MHGNADELLESAALMFGTTCLLMAPGLKARLKPMKETIADPDELMKIPMVGIMSPTKRNSNIPGFQVAVIVETIYVAAKPQTRTHPIMK